MIVTVYQQVFVEGAKTRVHVTITNENGAVLSRRFMDYDAFPLYQIAKENRETTASAVRRSLSAEKIIYDCNILGRSELVPNGGNYKITLISHPRFGPSSANRMEWVEPPTEDDTEEEA